MRGHIVKRSENSYSLVIYHGINPATGKKQYKWHTFEGTKKKAEAELNRLLNQLETGTYIDPSDLTVASYLDQWIKDYATTNVCAKTLERYKGIIDKHLAPAFGSLLLQKLHPIHIQSYYAEARRGGRKDKRDGGLSPQTVMHHHRLLSQALKMAVKWQLIARNPADAVEPPKVPEREVKVLDVPQTAWLIEVSEGTRLYLPIILAACAGLRRGEILALKWSDVLWDTGHLFIQRAVEETKLHGIRFKAPKTKRGRRMVRVGSMVIEALKRQREFQLEQQKRLGKDYQRNDLICCVEDGSIWKPSAFTSAYRDLLRRRKLTGLKFHEIRHTHASQLIADGTDIKTVSIRLGHSRTGFTLDTYTHLLPGQDEEPVKRMDSSLRAAREKLRLPV